jgi:hypothetical protein
MHQAVKTMTVIATLTLVFVIRYIITRWWVGNTAWPGRCRCGKEESDFFGGVRWMRVRFPKDRR